MPYISACLGVRERHAKKPEREKRKTEEESPSLAVAGSWAARKKAEAECPSLAIAGSWTADHSPNREW